MGKKKPLTKYQQFLADRLGWGQKINLSWNTKTGKWISRDRTPTEWRRLINGRLNSVSWEPLPDHSRFVPVKGSKYKKAIQSFERLKKAIVGDSYEEFERAVLEVRRAMKYQGYLQMEIAFIENLMEKSGDKELHEILRKKRLAMRLQEKVENINRGGV